MAPFWWSGTLSPQAEALLTQHIAQSGLSKQDVHLCQWSVYSKIHRDHPLSFALFSNLLDKLIKPIQTNLIREDDRKIFWEGAKNILPSCFNIIRKLRKKTSNEKNTMKQLIDVLGVLSKVMNLDPPSVCDLLPAHDYKWLQNRPEGVYADVRKMLEDAVSQGANDWFNYILENNTCMEDTDDGKLRYLIKIIQLVRSDLQKAIEFYDKSFQE